MLPTSALNLTKINLALSDGRSILVTKYTFDIIDSTQIWTNEHLRNVPENGWMAVVAKNQTGGIGTNGRTWHSPEGNIYVTFSTRLSKENPLSIVQKLRIPQITALAVVKTLENFGLAPQLKWVNDVLLNRKKISGILVGEQDDILKIGVGLNVNMEQKEADRVNEVCARDPNKIPATSLLIETGHSFDMEDVFQLLQQNLYKYMDLLVRGEFNFVAEVEQRLTCKKGEQVIMHSVQNPGQPLESDCIGIFQGLNAYGAIIMDTPEEGVIEINGGRMAI